MDPNPALTDITPPPSVLLHHALRLIPDPRDQCRPKHALPDLLIISLCSLLTGGDSFQDMADFTRDEAPWLRTVIPFRGGPPSLDTFTRVCALLDTHAFEHAVRHWMRQLLHAIPPPAPAAPALASAPALRQIACDGKTLRSSRRGASRIPPNGRHRQALEHRRRPLSGPAAHPRSQRRRPPMRTPP